MWVSGCVWGYWVGVWGVSVGEWVGCGVGVWGVSGWVGCGVGMEVYRVHLAAIQRRYDTRASIRLIASAITLSVGVIMPRLSTHAQRYCRGN